MAKRKFLGNGSYGCVYSPPLPCSKKDRENYTPRAQQPQQAPQAPQDAPTTPMVGKVFFTDTNFELELELIKFVKKSVDPESKFTMPLSATCAIAPPQPKDLGLHAPDACKSFQGREKQFIYPDGGNDLKHFALQYVRKPKQFFTMFKTMRPIFEGLVTMSQKRVVHCDIKPDNVLYNPKTKRCILIDYGLMATFDTLYKDVNGSDSLKDVDYMYFPIEFKMHYVYSQTKQIKPNTLLQSFTSSFAHMRDPASFFNMFDVDLLHDIQTLCEKEAAIQSKQPLSSRTPKSTTVTGKGLYNSSNLVRIDVYALGITLAEVLRIMKLARISAMDYTKYDRMKLMMIKQLIHHMIRPNLYERWTPEQCLAYYDEVCMCI
jgi:serine/threonine protein kinase